MTKLEEVIASLSEEELDLLNSDPELLAKFKAKYAPKVNPPALDTALRTMTASMNPNPPGIVPEAANIPATTGKQAGKALEEHIAEGLGEAGYPLTGAALATAGGALTETYKSFMSPDVILAGGALEAALAPLGKAVSGLLRSWGSDAALKAAGYIKSLGDAIGVTNFEEFGQFLLSPFKAAGKEFEPIVTAGATKPEMLAKVTTAANAAGKFLETTGKSLDDIVTKTPDKLNLEPIVDGINALKAEIERHTPELEKAVITQYEKLLDDFYTTVSNGLKDKNIFRSLQELKTRIGKMVFHDEKLVPSKEALNQALQILSSGIDDVARTMSPEAGAALAEASDIYHKLLIVKSALEGAIKSNAGKGVNWAISASVSPTMALLGTLAGGPVLGSVIGAAGALAPHIPAQTIASGLNVAAKFVTPALKVTAQGVPVAAKAISQGLAE